MVSWGWGGDPGDCGGPWGATVGGLWVQGDWGAQGRGVWAAQGKGVRGEIGMHELEGCRQRGGATNELRGCVQGMGVHYWGDPPRVCV